VRHLITSGSERSRTVKNGLQIGRQSSVSIGGYTCNSLRERLIASSLDSASSTLRALSSVGDPPKPSQRAASDLSSGRLRSLPIRSTHLDFDERFLAEGLVRCI